MPREKAGYRDTIEDLRERGYPPVLTSAHIMEIMGYKSSSSVRNHFKLINGKIAVADFARQICQ
jgi:SOS-response transcriptional repressor LexA